MPFEDPNRCCRIYQNCLRGLAVPLTRKSTMLAVAFSVVPLLSVFATSSQSRCSPLRISQACAMPLRRWWRKI